VWMDLVGIQCASRQAGEGGRRQQLSFTFSLPHGYAAAAGSDNLTDCAHDERHLFSHGPRTCGHGAPQTINWTRD